MPYRTARHQLLRGVLIGAATIVLGYGVLGAVAFVRDEWSSKADLNDVRDAIRPVLDSVHAIHIQVDGVKVTADSTATRLRQYVCRNQPPVCR